MLSIGTKLHESDPKLKNYFGLTWLNKTIDTGLCRNADYGWVWIFSLARTKIVHCARTLLEGSNSMATTVTVAAGVK